MQEKPTIGLYHDTRYASKKHDGKYPIKVRVTWEIKRKDFEVKYVGTDQYVDRQEFIPIEKKKAKGTLREQQDKVVKVWNEVINFIDDNPNIGPTQFENAFKNRSSGKFKGVNVYDVYKTVIAEKEKDGDLGTADSYESSMASIKRYAGADLYFHDVNVKWLKGYEAWKLTQRNRMGEFNSLTTVGMYLRALRAIFNRAIADGHATTEMYPFGKGKYRIRKKRTAKRGMGDATESFVNFQTELRHENEAIDFCVLSFYSNGMNFKDIAYLRDASFHGDHFKFIREKTKKTTHEVREIPVFISEEIADILSRRIKRGHTYVFGIINDDMTPREKRRAVAAFVRRTNKNLKKIAEKIGFKGRLTTYSMRHTFVTALLNMGVPITKVADSIGNTTLENIRHYAEDYNIESSKQFSGLLRPGRG